MLVEDEAIIAMAEKRTLEKAGYRVLTASNGRKAIEMANKGHTGDIDLILMDIDLGSGMDGTEAAQIILEEQEIPLAFLSSHTEPGVVKKTEGITSYGYIVKHSGDTVLLASIKMAFRLAETKRELQMQKEHLRQALIHQEDAEDELRHNEERFQRTLNAIPDMISIHDRDFNIIYSNWKGLAKKSSGRQKTGEKCYASYRGYETICPDCRARDVLKDGLPVEAEVQLPDGRWMELKVLPLPDRDGEVNLFVEWVRDITPRKKLEFHLRESEEKWKSYIEHAPYGVFIADPEGRYLETNPAASDITGYSAEELHSMAIIDLLPPESREPGIAHFRQVMETGEARGEAPFIRKDGALRWWNVRARKLSEDRFIGFAEDTTERRAVAQALQSEVSEKELLLRESHHRIKNNIGSIRSLLQLQLAKVSGDEAKDALRAAAARVGSMHHLYERMLAAGASGKADIATFLPDLAGTVENLFTSGGGVEITCTIDSVEVDAKQLFPLGIMVNEALTNSMKYAFSPEGTDSPSITLRGSRINREETCYLIVEVEDNGSGLPENFDPRQPGGFGFQLLQMLSRQIQAELEIGKGTNGRGTRIGIHIPLPSNNSSTRKG